MSDYPEHEKLHKIKDLSQACGEFVDWLRAPEDEGGKGVHFMVWREWTESENCWNCNGDGEHSSFRGISRCSVCRGKKVVTRHRDGWMPLDIPLKRLLAEHFEIDLDKLEDEKTALLEAQRALNESVRPG